MKGSEIKVIINIITASERGTETKKLAEIHYVVKVSKSIKDQGLESQEFQESFIEDVANYINIPSKMLRLIHSSSDMVPEYLRKNGYEKYFTITLNEAAYWKMVFWMA